MVRSDPEQPVRALHALYQRVVENTSEGVWVIDVDNVTTFVNQSMADMLGFDRDDLVGRSVFDFMDDEGRRIAAANVERRRAGISEAHEFVFRRKDGRPLWARMITDPLTDEAGQYAGALALVTDITDERDRGGEREVLWHILDESLNEIYLFREGDLRFEYVNRGALRNLGYSREQTRAMTPVDLEPEFTPESFAALLAPLLDGRAPKLVFRTVHARADGSTYPIEAHLQLVAKGTRRLFLAVINDITAQEQAEQDVRRSEARFRTLTDDSLDLLLLTDAQGRFTFVSGSISKVLGYTIDEFLGHQAVEFMHPEDAPAAVASFERSLRGGAVAERIEFRARHRDGTWRTLSGMGRNLLDNPAVGALVLNARDVTGERRLEEQLQQSQRLESVGRLAGGIAHDFNNILTTILGSAAFLEDDNTLSEDVLGDVREIKQAAQRASELTGQLLAFARKRLIRPESIDLRRAISTQEKFLRRVIGENIELSTRTGPAVSPVLADRTQIEQVILNLAVNARDAMPAGGRLVLELDDVYLDEGFAETHADVQPGPYVLLAVSDTGEGIAPEVLPHIFEPFFTTKPVGTGTGLGLATVYGIVKQNGGHIWVDSEPGVGTTFKLYFRRAPTDEEATPESPGASADRGAERILVVEDDAAVRATLLRGLSHAGYDVHAAATPAEGLAWARANAGAFALLVTDVLMPGMTGPQLAAAVLAEFPAVRVLYVSGYTQDAIVHGGELDKSVELLAKPFSPTQLHARVREVLDRG